ncbi:MAG: phenylalanine--tRNA ligase subunit beta [Pediococcus pentosaceus]|jgi:phenylalanyl-tRNA synthetase beta chain|uniref:phenylalanine--tRNA ligase subunit beta n=1 Tax=Pediococcus pentosaceus TaxID=1255 RepID=UPI00191A35E3|nr:phenylalanine--tRNA ligase subunit beta [Pediococcus pentosaceus]MCH4015363.1 phenylalanine--tRNA ligase subunit beta [Pediococcus pentosaceus]MCH4098868.1 phenylalanine--tRNA ligase subunit beta [Pediococcus pentosaceus]MCI1506593.1 phenylalanine--tRNA ligase subunit beta [Pediococcus pentosaceus]MCQ0027944.1 phenylalanine--tRNA ligase subunit beta [Pediococcus pentosaceus]MCT3024808.1 phenylalanine--tRNA ligase subunit beta [Pediococcus pentosaceus]
MKLSYKWLSKYLELDLEPKDLAEKIERTAVEVDSVTRLDYKLKKIVVGHTLEVTEHPDSDHLHICQVDVGEEEPIQIVCGAPNIAADQDVIVALHGSRIKDNVKIKRSKMRGVPSNGMICALQEIGYPDNVVPKDYADGIYVFPADSHVKPGDSVMEALGMDDDVIDTSVTPNRGDMFGMNGNAHEIAAILDQKANFEVLKVQDEQKSADTLADQIKVEIDEQDVAPVYKLMAIENVKIAPSPFWLQTTLMKAGIRPINNVVDVTNYIMLKYGQPLHAYDLDQLKGQTISVAPAGENVKFTTLDDEKRDLRPEDLVITADGTPIAMAGVMGGMATEVSDQTQNIVIEAAIFDPIKVRKTARYHNLHSEAAMRFERGIDYSSLDDALNEAASLVADFGQGKVMSGVVVGNDTKLNPESITIALARINKILGTSLTSEEVVAIFDRLGFSTELDATKQTFKVTVPVRRWDIHIEADLLEEVARIFGYDNLPVTLPTGDPTIGQLTTEQKLMRASRTVMEGLGLTQAMSYGLTTIAKSQQFVKDDHELVKVDWPMTKDREALRMNLISGLLDDIAYNKARSVENVALYEQGRVFYGNGQAQPEEIEHIAGAITGSMQAKSWNEKEKPVTFFDVKGIVEQYLKNVAVAGEVSYVADHDRQGMHPGRTADVLLDGDVIGFIGQIHPTTAEEFKIKETYVFELNLTKIIHAEKKLQHYDVISRYPAITRDIAILVNKEVSNTEVLNVINETKQKNLIKVELFDVYEGKNLEKGMKSLAYQFTYQDTNDTLQEDAINDEFSKVIKNLEEKLNVTVR